VKTDARWQAPREEGIVAHAIHTGADLVIKDAHRHPPMSHMPTVQTDWVLIRQLPMPLLLVHPAPWGAHALVAASVDPIHIADRPVQLDQSLARLAGAIGETLSGEAVLLHVTEPTPHLPGDAVPEAIRAEDVWRQREAVSTLATEASIRVDDSSFIEERVPQGIVQLVARTRPAILLMGASARERIQVGAVSTASQVLERTDCDLLVIKPRGFVSPAMVARS
jgi:universal stress protein E